MAGYIGSGIAEKHAQHQGELVDIRTDKGRFKEEKLQHPLCIQGFSVKTDNGFERMDAEDVAVAIKGILQARPSARLVDATPQMVEYKERSIVSHSAIGFKMSMQEKAETIAKEFYRNPRAVGFKIELHDVDSDKKTPSASLSVYELIDDIELIHLPVEIFVRYRRNF